MRTPLCPLFCAVLGALLPTATAQVIDFETTPSGVRPTDDAALSRTTPYIIDGVEVTLGFDTDGDYKADIDAVFEHRGQDGNDGFVSVFGSEERDSERDSASSSLGRFFLRQPAAIGAVPGRFIIAYDQDISTLSGEIWDHDGPDDPAKYEQWRITALDSLGNPIGNIETPRGLSTNDPRSRDSLPLPFQFEGGGIRKIAIEFIGTSTMVGLAFDNFRPTTTPELPSAEIKDSVTICFQSTLGETYTIQESTDLDNWIDVTELVGDGTEQSVSYLRSIPRKFYRLKPPAP